MTDNREYLKQTHGRGRPPFGFGSQTIRLDQCVQLKIMHFSEERHGFITSIKDARAQSAADLLNQLGGSSSRGTSWTSNSVKSVMKDSLYSQLIQYVSEQFLQALKDKLGEKSPVRKSLLLEIRRRKSELLSLQDQLLVAGLSQEVDQHLVAHLLGDIGTLNAIPRFPRNGTVNLEYFWKQLDAEIFLCIRKDLTQKVVSERFYRGFSKYILETLDASKVFEFDDQMTYTARLQRFLDAGVFQSATRDVSTCKDLDQQISKGPGGQGFFSSLPWEDGSSWTARWHSLVDSIQSDLEENCDVELDVYQKVRTLWLRLRKNEKILEDAGFGLQRKLSDLVQQVASARFTSAYEEFTSSLSTVDQLASSWVQYLTPESSKPSTKKTKLPVGSFSSPMDTNCCLLNQISTANVAFRFRHELEVIKEEFHSDRFDRLKIQEWTDFLGFSFREFGGEYTNVQNRFDEIEKKIFPNHRVENAEKHALFQCFPHPNLLEELFRRSLNEGFLKFLLLFETVLFAGFHQVTTINSGFPLRNPALLESVLFSAIFTKNLLSPFYSLSTAESRFSEDPNVGFYESFERLLSFRAYVSGLDEAEIVSSVDESKGKPDRPLFLISDSSAQRRDFIRRLTSTEPAAAGHLAWADFEWTVRRAIRLLSSHTSVDVPLSQLAERFIGLPELEQCWDDQVRPKFGRPLSVVVPDWDYLINESSKLRTLDIHRIGRELEGHFMCDAVESVLSATKSVIDHVAETGKDIFTDPRLCEDDPSYS